MAAEWGLLLVAKICSCRFSPHWSAAWKYESVQLHMHMQSGVAQGTLKVGLGLFKYMWHTSALTALAWKWIDTQDYIMKFKLMKMVNVAEL